MQCNLYWKRKKTNVLFFNSNVKKRESINKKNASKRSEFEAFVSPVDPEGISPHF